VDLTTGLPTMPPVMRQSYDIMQPFIDPALICSLLAERFQLHSSSVLNQSTAHDDPERLLARQFIRLHEMVVRRHPNRFDPIQDPTAAGAPNASTGPIKND
jgi:hypothetical protein